MVANPRSRHGMWASKNIIALLVVMAIVGDLKADVKTKAIQEAAEAMMARYGSRAVGRTLPSLVQKMESFAARYGEEGLAAMRRAGPAVFTAVEEAGVNGPKAVRLLAQFGEEGATCVLRKPKAMQAFLRYGEEAAAVLVRHPGVAEGLLEKGGASAVQALTKVTPQGARRIAMVMENELQHVAQKPELMGVIGKYGQKACDFCWENKKILALGSACAAFVANPEPFLNGTTKLAETVIEKSASSVAKPIAEGVAKGTNWTAVILSVLGVVSVFIAVKSGTFRRKLETPSGS